MVFLKILSIKCQISKRVSRDAQWVGRHVARHGHDTCSYNMARYEHIYVGTWYSKACMCTIQAHLGKRVLQVRHDQKLDKTRHVKRHAISIFHFLMKVNLKFYNFTNNLKLNLLIYFISTSFLISFNSQFKKNTLIDLYL